MINVDLLIEYGGIKCQFSKREIIFQENDKAIFYYQIIIGKVKMNNYDNEGNETIQGIFNNGQSFGEPPILGNFLYPANAETMVETTIIKLEKNRLFELLKENVEISIQLLKTLSNRLHFKAILSKEIKGYNAEHKILTLLTLFKKENDNEETCINVTRQTIAKITGLRTETVIRVVKKLEKQQKLKLIKRKIYI